MKPSFEKYLDGVFRRLGRYAWLPLLTAFILVLNAHAVDHVLYNGDFLSLHNGQLLLSIAGIPLTIWLLVCLISQRTVRRIAAGVSVAIIGGMHIVDLYLIHTYQMPYNDVIVAPILATNPEETWGFLTSMNLWSSYYLIEGGKLLLAVLLAISLPMGVRYLWRDCRDSARTQRIVQISMSCLILAVCTAAGAAHIAHTKRLYKENNLQYHSLNPVERVLLSAYRERPRRETPCILPQAAPCALRTDTLLPPHNVIIVTAGELYTELMHCYNEGNSLNTPRIDSMIAAGELIRFDHAYAPSDGSMAGMLSVGGSDGSRNRRQSPSIYSALRQAGYETYWIDNTPQYRDDADDLISCFIRDCDSACLTNPWVEDQYLYKTLPHDEVVLQHLKKARQHSLASTIRLLGGNRMWWSVPETHEKWNRLTATTEAILSGDEMDGVAQMHNVVFYQDSLCASIIGCYRQTPAIIYFVGETPVYNDWYPYTSRQVADEEKGRVPMFVYVSPSMERLRPQLKSQLRRQSLSRYDLEDFPSRLFRTLGIHCSE